MNLNTYYIIKNESANLKKTQKMHKINIEIKKKMC